MSCALGLAAITLQLAACFLAARLGALHRERRRWTWVWASPAELHLQHDGREVGRICRRADGCWRPHLGAYRLTLGDDLRAACLFLAARAGAPDALATPPEVPCTES